MSHQLLRSDGQQHRQMGDYEAKRDGAADRRDGVVGARKRNIRGRNVAVGNQGVSEKPRMPQTFVDQLEGCVQHAQIAAEGFRFGAPDDVTQEMVRPLR